jgi:anti-sigma factor RsiW
MTRDCTFSEAVLAHFLDGEASCGAAPPPAELAAHLGDCAECQDALARGRRLDALLASISRPEPDGAMVERLLAGAATAARAVDGVETAAPRRSAARTWALRAALVAGGFAAAWAWRGASRHAAPTAEDAAVGPTAAAETISPA